jgi:hypothetical protein
VRMLAKNQIVVRECYKLFTIKYDVVAFSAVQGQYCDEKHCVKREANSIRGHDMSAYIHAVQRMSAAGRFNQYQKP